VFITGGKSSLYPGGEITADLATSEIYTYATLPEVHKPIWTDMVNAFGFALSPGPIPTVFNGFQKLREAGPLVYPSEPETYVIPSQLFATTQPDYVATNNYDLQVYQFSYTAPLETSPSVVTVTEPYIGLPLPHAKFLFGFEPNKADWAAGVASISLYIKGGTDSLPVYTARVHLYRGSAPFTWAQYDTVVDPGSTFVVGTAFNLFTFTMPVQALSGPATDFLYMYVGIVASIATSAEAEIGYDGVSNFTALTVPFTLSTSEPDTSLAVCYRLTDSDGRIWRSSPYIFPNSLVWDAEPVVVIPVVPITPTSPTLLFITVTPNATTISTGEYSVGGSMVFTAIGTYSDGSTADITAQADWSVENPALLRFVDYFDPFEKVVIAIPPASPPAPISTTTLRVALNGITTIVPIVINADNVVSMAFSAPPTGLSLLPEETVQLKVAGTYVSSGVQDVTWSVGTWGISPSDVVGGTGLCATIDANGLLTVSLEMTGYSQTVSITATSPSIVGPGGQVTTSPIALVLDGIASLSSIVITPSTYNIEVGSALALSATANFTNSFPSRDVTKKATWTSSNEAVAVVDDSGNVTAVSSGTVTITATWSPIIGSPQSGTANLIVYTVASQVIPTSHVVRIPTLRHLMENTIAEIEFYFGQVDLQLYAVYPNDPTVPYLEVYPNATYPGISNTGLQKTLREQVATYGPGEALYTTGGALENANPPIARCAAVWRNRAFVCNGNTICPSQEFADGLGIQWNEVTYIQWTDGTGDILACAPTDWNYLVFFKKDAVGVINGPGPDGAGNGNYIVQTLATKVGCSNVKSIVTAADGVYFQDSQTGRLMCLTTSLGAPTECAPGVFNLLDTASNSPTGAYPSPITCALHVEKDRQVWFFVGGHVKSLVVLDYKHRTERCPAGSVYTWPLSASVGAMCISQGFPMLVMKDGSMAFQSPGIWVDQLNPATGQGDQITMHVKSADHSPLGLQRQFDLSRVAFIGEFLTPHGLTLIVNPDFGIAGIPTSITISGPPEQVILRPARCMRIQAVSFDVQETITLDTENNPIVGPGFKFVGFALEVQDYGKIAMLSTGRLA
jgi:hypothetical protein